MLAWIGPERGDTALAVDWIKRVAGLTKGFGDDVFRDYENGEERRKVETLENLTQADSEKLGVPFDNGAAWTAFSAFYDRSWFERIWVVQEVLPAREAWLICGSHSIEWHHVKAAAAWYRYKCGSICEKYDSTRTIDGIGHACAMNLAWRSRAGSEFLAPLFGQVVRPTYRWAFEELLSTFRRRLAGDPRDKVFALLGISTLEYKLNSPLLRPDYEKSTLEVFRDTTRGFIEAESAYSGALNILLGAVPHSNESGWPSWVPDWRITDTSDVGGPLPDSERVAGFKNTHEYVVPEPGEEHELHVEGHIIGKVVHRSEHHHIGGLLMDLREERDLCRRVYEERFSTTLYGPTNADGDDIDTAWAMSLQGGRLHHGFEEKGTTPQQFGEILVDMVDVMKMPRSRPEEEKTRQTKVMPYMEKYGLDPYWLEYTRQRYCERRWFITDTGFIGLGNHHLEEGDVITVLWGLDIACVLRPVEQDEAIGKAMRYNFVGEAYCHGAKEAVEQLSSNNEERAVGAKMILV